MKHFISRLMLAVYIYLRNCTLVDSCLLFIIYFFLATATEYFTDPTPTFTDINIILISACAIHIITNIVWWYRKIL